MSVVARLESISAPASIETASIENISNHGARVITSRRWSIDDRLVLTSFGFRSAVAQVIYCQTVSDGRCAIGIKFGEPILEPMMSAAFKATDA